MTHLLQYRFPEAMRPGGLGGHALGNLLIAALSDMEGDFEEGVRRMNRGVGGTRASRAGCSGAPDAPRRAGRRDTAGRSVGHRTGTRHPPRLDRTERCARHGRCRRGHPGCRSHRPWTRQPLHEPAAEPAGGRDPRGAPGGSSTGPLRRQRRHAGRGDRGVHARRPSPGHRRQRRRWPHWTPSWPNDDLAARAPRDWPARAIEPTLPDAWRDRVRFRSAPVVDPANAHRHDPQRLAAAIVAYHADGLAVGVPVAEAARSA